MDRIVRNANGRAYPIERHLPGAGRIDQHDAPAPRMMAGGRDVGRPAQRLHHRLGQGRRTRTGRRSRRHVGRSSRRGCRLTRGGIGPLSIAARISIATVSATGPSTTCTPLGDGRRIPRAPRRLSAGSSTWPDRRRSGAGGWCRRRSRSDWCCRPSPRRRRTAPASFPAVAAPPCPSSIPPRPRARRLQVPAADGEAGTP